MRTDNNNLKFLIFWWAWKKKFPKKKLQNKNILHFVTISTQESCFISFTTTPLSNIIRLVYQVGTHVVDSA